MSSTRAWVIDGTVAVAALAVSAPYAFSGGAVSALPVWTAVLIVLAMVGPLVLRRRWPVPVFGWGVLVAAATGWWANQIVWSPMLLVALYTVAALRPRREAFVACGVLSAACVVAAVHVIPSGWYGTAASLVAVSFAATGFGLYVGTRRVLLDQLQERAARLEYERDQRGALAAAAERARIAREMHDIVAHHLTVMVALSDGAAVRAARAPEQAVEAMRSVSATGRLALADTRRLLGVLRDDQIADAARDPLPDIGSVDELVERVRAAGLPVRYTTEGTRPDVPTAVQLTVFRLVQEALTNTMKHGGVGAQATVRICCRPDEVRVQVDDDGQAVVGATAEDGGGLAGMRERVAVFGGEVTSGPRSPHGWSVSARLLLDRVRA